MVEKINKIFEKKSTVLLATLGMVAITLIYNKIDATIAGQSGQGIIYLELAFIKKDFIAILLNWGNAGIELFLKTLWLDFLYPIFYATMLSSAIVNLAKIAKEKKFQIEINPKIIKLPFVALFFDYMENILLYFILSQKYFDKNLILISSTMSYMKFLILCFMIFYLLKIYFNFRKKNKKGIAKM